MNVRASKPKKPFRLSKEQKDRVASKIEHAQQKGYERLEVYVRGKQVKVVPVRRGKPESF